LEENQGYARLASNNENEISVKLALARLKNYVLHTNDFDIKGFAVGSSPVQLGLMS
jgi:hypothetical protein